MENKRIMSLFAILVMVFTFVSGCKSDETIIGSELIKIDENDYVSSEAEIGDLAKIVRTEASSFYPITAEITANNGGVILTDVKVKNLDYVKKGDLLAEIRPYSAEEIAAKEKTISDKENELSSMMAFYDSEANELNSLIASSTNSIDKAIYEQQLIENELNRNYTNEKSLKEIETLKEELEIMKEEKGDCNIYAPFDGVVDKVYVSTPDTVLSESTLLFSMHSVDTVVIYFDDPGYVYCENEVKVIAGSGDTKQEIAGKVVCADHYLHPDIRQGKIFVRLEGEYDKENLEPIEVELTTYNVKNVLTTKSTGINNIKDKDYVYIMEDGKLKRRHVVVGGSDGENTWILQGVDEGDLIYLQ